MKQYFKYVEFSEDKWFITPIHEMFGERSIHGSYAVIAARFYGLSWPDWLKYCAQNGAKLEGKNSTYVSVFWSKPNYEFLKEMNERVNKIASQINIKELKY